MDSNFRILVETSEILTKATAQKKTIQKVGRSKSYPAFITLPETNIAHENTIFPCKYHQNGGFSMAMLVSGRVPICRDY